MELLPVRTCTSSLNDDNDLIFWNRPLPRKLLLALSELNVKCFMFHASQSSFKNLSLLMHLHVMYVCTCMYTSICMVHVHVHTCMYDFTRLMRAIVCGEIDLCQNFESGFRRRISQKKNHDCIVP